VANYAQEKMNRRNKRIFEAVADTYRTIVESGVKLGAQDYSSNTGGQGAQYDPCAGMRTFAYIDFTIDVDNILDKYFTLGGGDYYEIRRRWFVGVSPDDDVQSTECVIEQCRLGRMFKEAALYPTNKYFETVKR